MAKYGSPSVLIGVSTASGSTAIKDLSQYIEEIDGVKINAMTQETHAFGDSWVKNAYTGVRGVEDMKLTGFYDDAASGPHSFMGQTSDIGAERQFEIDFGSSDIVHGSYVLLSYSRIPTRDELTRFEAEWQFTGAITTTT